jgi:hypothetical protein
MEIAMSRTCLATIIVFMASAAGAQELKRLAPDNFDKVQRLIKPEPGEARWAEVPWMLSSDIWAARKKAAEEGKPLFLWYMAGEPLGTC